MRALTGAELFQLHDSDGFPLSCSIVESRRLGLEVDLFGFAHAALEAGWSSETTQRILRAEIADADAIEPRVPA